MISKTLFCVLLIVQALVAKPDLQSLYQELEGDDPGYNILNEMHEEEENAKQFERASAELQPGFWQNQAQVDLKEKVDFIPNKGIAKNVILLVASGMSVTTMTAARTFMGQQQNRAGEEAKLSFESFSSSGLIKTYCVNKQAADAACAANAFLSGVKTNVGTLGVSASVARGDWAASQEAKNQIKTIAKWSQIKGKRTGVVTTARVTDATPAALYARTADRRWENDFVISLARPKPAQDYPDIADQLINGETGKSLDVVLGGGQANFLPVTKKDQQGKKGWRMDGRDLIKEWQRQNKDGKYVSSRQQLLENNNKQTQKVLGLFSRSHMPYNLDRDAEAVPSLAEMTEAAIQVLAQGQNGYFLLVEGGRIDHANDAAKARKALDEALEFDKAVQAALKLTKSEETLIVVTADHGHTVSFNGNANRGSDVLGIAGKAADSLPYTTLAYSNGPGYRRALVGRYDISKDNLADKDYKYPSLAPKTSGTHGAEDVSVHAQGPWAHLISGVHEQNYLAYAIAYASCVGEGITACG